MRVPELAGLPSQPRTAKHSRNTTEARLRRLEPLLGLEPLGFLETLLELEPLAGLL